MAYVEHQLGEESYFSSGSEIISHNWHKHILQRSALFFPDLLFVAGSQVER